LETMPAKPFARAARVGSDILRPCVYFSIISFDTSSEVKAMTLPGNDPIADVPKPLKMPGMPSLLIICLNTENPVI